ncbi:MAG TPA: EAL domain-containing protein [Actinomycetota bacterium]|nr:EAL domain-containing protein [Actinomycetota bacterium]
MGRRSRPGTKYLALVCLVGAGALAGLVAQAHGDFSPFKSPEFLPFSLFVLLGQLLPIRVTRHGEEEEITTSTTFVFALLLAAGPLAAAAAQTVSSFFGDILQRRPLSKAAFNASRSTIAISASAGVLFLLTELPHPSPAAPLAPRDLPAVLVAAGVFFLANTTFHALYIALAQNLPLVTYVRRHVTFQALSDGVLLALSPTIAVVARTNLFLVPLLTIPIVAVAKSANVYLMNAGLVEKLDESLNHLLEMNERNEYQATHDILTELPNRTAFRSELEKAIRTSVSEGRVTAVMMIDLDHFKDINNTLGPQYGDMVLKQVGPRLHDVLGEGPFTARLGGDEFGVLLPDAGDDVFVQHMATKILKTLERPFSVGEFSLHVEGRIGIALCPEHGQGVETLMRRADLALNMSRGRGTGFQVYSPKQDQQGPNRLALLGDLRRALKENELIVHYQPKAEIKTGKVTSAEALVRWRHPERGMVPPNQFIPLAEHTTLITGLTFHVLDAVLAQSRRWTREHRSLTVSVNLSARNLLDPKLPDEIDALLKKWGVPVDHLELEITESTVLGEPDRALEILNRLRGMGLNLSLDDFGTGYSSLAYLQRLPVHELKIDRSFVKNMTTDESDAKIVKSTIDLGRNLGLQVVAEGVESEEIWYHLADLDCDYIQGYYLSRPLPADELSVWLKKFDRGEIKIPMPSSNGRGADASASSSDQSSVGVAGASTTPPLHHARPGGPAERA